MNTYTLTYRDKRRLHDRAFRAQQNDHFEVCGVLMANKRKQLSLHFVKNHSKVPYHNEMYWSQIDEVKKVHSKKRFVGLFHSHPVGYAVPGKSDLRGHPLNHLELIYDVCAREAKLWRIVKRGRTRKALPVSLIIHTRPANNSLQRTTPAHLQAHAACKRLKKGSADGKLNRLKLF
jgi:proteasome lid subunit RPN8/RPN11